MEEFHLFTPFDDYEKTKTASALLHSKNRDLFKASILN